MPNPATKKSPKLNATARALSPATTTGSLSAGTKEKAAGAKGEKNGTFTNHDLAKAVAGAVNELTRKGKPKYNPDKIVADQDRAAMGELGELVEVELDAIQISPDQPRKEFNEAKLRELSESICGKNGQPGLGLLQPLLVARCGGIYELIAGERRYRACRLGGISRVPCYVREMTSQQISSARLVENDQREDLSPIERARAYQKHLTEFKVTQEQLAAELGISQGQLSNTMRFLKLPKEWQLMIISGEITKSQARDLVPWCDLPEVLEELKGDMPKDTRPADLAPVEWGSSLLRAIESCSECAEGGKWMGGGKQDAKWDFTKADDETRKQLDIRTVRTEYDGDQPRCFNVKLYETLTKQIINEAQKKADKKLSREVDGPAGGKNGGAAQPKRKPTAAELKAKEEQHQKRIYRYKIAWLQQQIGESVDSIPDGELLIFVIGLSVTGNTVMGPRCDMLWAAFEQAGLDRFSGKHTDEAIWKWLVGLDRGKLRKGLIAFVKHWTTIEARSWSRDANPVMIESFASTLGINLKGWRADEAFLKLFNIEQLRELMKPWKMNTFAEKKAEVVEFILDHAGQTKAPPELLNVKPCTLD